MEQLSNDEWSAVFCFLEIDDVLKNCCLTCLHFYKIITNENTEISQRINYLKNLNNSVIDYNLNIDNNYLFDFLTISCRLQKLPCNFIENNFLDKNIKPNYWRSEIFSFSLISYNNFYVKNYLENNNFKIEENITNLKLFKAMIKGFNEINNYDPIYFIKDCFYSSLNKSPLPILFDTEQFITKNTRDVLFITLQKNIRVLNNNKYLNQLTRYFCLELIDFDIISCFNYLRNNFPFFCFRYLELGEKLNKILQQENNLDLDKIKKIYCIIFKKDYPVELYNNLTTELKNDSDLLYNAISKRHFNYSHYEAYPYLYFKAGINAQLDSSVILQLLNTKKNFRLFNSSKEQVEFFKEILKLKEIKITFIYHFFNHYNGIKDFKEMKSAVHEITEEDFFCKLLPNIVKYRAFCKVMPKKYWEDEVLLKRMMLVKPTICFAKSTKFWCFKMELLMKVIKETNNNYLQNLYNNCTERLKKKDNINL
ncbi:hypothetical protein ABK040_011869 [Willaertia magna]